MAARKIITIVAYNEDDIYAENGVHDKIQSMKREIRMLNDYDINKIFTIDDFEMYFYFILDMWNSTACTAVQAEHVNVMHNLANTGYDVFNYKTGNREWDPEIDPPPLDVIGLAYIAACKCTKQPYRTVACLASLNTPQQQNKTNFFNAVDDDSSDSHENKQDQKSVSSKATGQTKKSTTTKNLQRKKAKNYS